MTELIKDTLMKKRDYEAEYRFLKFHLENTRNKDNAIQQERLSFLEKQLHNIEVWMELLTEDEAFVVRRHLFDGIDIPRIAIEYRERWGEEYGKTERTIKTYQRRALQKIAGFELLKNKLLEG